MPHGIQQDINIINQARKFNQPLRMCNIKDETISSDTYFTTDKDNIIISALRYQDSDIFIRAYEAVGNSYTTCEIKIPPYIKSYSLSDGIQNAIGDKISCKDTISFEFKGFEIINILLYEI